tara:strand:+ start:393 stop:647 length:255 start_codon:yes stop_codon:yes gene_type:complete
MLFIEDPEEGQELIRLPIMNNKEATELLDYTNFEWLVLGAMQSTKKVWEYGFRAPSKTTMYCKELELRRYPSSQEMDEIKELNE